MKNTTPKNKNGNLLLVANYASNVGYAWWLMGELLGQSRPDERKERGRTF